MLSVIPANSNLLGPAASSVPGVAQAGSQSTANILQPAAPVTAPAQTSTTTAQNGGSGGYSTPVATSTPATTPAKQQPTSQPAQTFSFGNGKTYDVNGNEVDQNGNIANNAGLAGMSSTDYLNLLGSETATNTGTYKQIQSDLGIPAASTAAFATPQQSTVDVYNQAYNTAGLGDLKQKISDYNDQIAQTNQQYIDAVGKENENPFLSDAARVGRTSQLYNTAQQTIGNLINEQANYQNLYAQGVNEANNMVTRYTNDFTTNQSVNQQKLTYLLSQAEKQQGAAQNTATQQLIQRYYPEYLSASAQTTAAEKVFGTPQTGLYSYDPTTKTYKQISPPTGQYSAITTPTGQVYGFNSNTGQTNTTGTNTYSGQSGTTASSGVGGYTAQPLVSSTDTLSKLLGTYVNGPNSTQSASYESGVISTLQSMGVNVNSNTPVSQLQQYIPQISQAISTNEGYNTAKAPSITQANNPGAIEWAAAQQYGLDKQYGAVPFKGQNGITYAGFSSPQVGMQALQSYLGSIMGVSQPANNNVGGMASSGQGGLSVSNAPANQGDISGVTQLTQAFSNLAPSFSSTQQLALSTSTFQGYLQSGNTEAAANFINTLAYKAMQPNTQSKVDNVSEAIDAYTQALTILNNHPELSTGVYQNIVQSAKPWAGTNPTKDYQQFNQLMNVGNSLLENGLYGIRLNPTDIGQSSQFQPGQDDPTATVITKLKGAIGFFNYANAKTYSAQTGVPAPALTTFLQQSGYQQ
jgi:hypothetical protein